MKKVSGCLALMIAMASGLAAHTGESQEKRGDESSTQNVTAAVRAVLDEQVAAWNRGDVEAFMDGYARSAETTFVSGANVVRGWQTVLERYRKDYGSREKMGTLAFSELEIQPLAADSALVLGRWQLTRANDAPHGRFTLVLRRTAPGWRIVHDHTSAAPTQN